MTTTKAAHTPEAETVDWSSRGYQAGLNGCAPWMPHKHNLNDRASYFDGYERGCAERAAISRAEGRT